MPGTLLVLEQLSIVVGIVVSYFITFGTRFISSEWSFRLPFLLQILPAIFLGSAVFLLPFSPRWLAQKGRDDEVLASLSKLRQVPAADPRVQAEWLEIRAEADFYREVQEKRHPGLVSRAENSFLPAVELAMAGFADCFKNGYLKRTMVGIMLMFFQQFVGINALIYYSPSLFQTMGIGYEMRLVLGGILNVTQLVGVLTSLYTMDAWGRRPLIIWGAAGMGICHVIIAVLVALYNDSWAEHVDMGWVSVAFLFLYMLLFGATWGPVPWGKSSSAPAHPTGAVSQKLTSRFSHAERDLPLVDPIERCRLGHVLELAEQLHHRPHHAAADPKHQRIRGLHLLCGVLFPGSGVGVVPGPRNEGAEFGGYGRGVW